MKVNVGVVQDSPVFFDLHGTLDKLENLVVKYAKEGCELLVFPESFIPGYPRGFDFGASVGNRSPEGKSLYAEYHANSLSIQSAEMQRLVSISAQNSVYLVIGFTEKSETNGSLYCSMAYISPTDGILGVHRKIKPTGTERVIWAEADGTSLVTVQTKIGKMGGLICWENYMPLARMAMYQKGIDLYLAPTADSRTTWTTTLQQIALEGRCFVLGCNQYFTKSMYPEQYQDLAKDAPEDFCKGGSVIVNPNGECIAGPLFGTSGILIAELDYTEIIQAKMEFDVAGHYARNDIFTFEVVGQPPIKKEKNV